MIDAVMIPGLGLVMLQAESVLSSVRDRWRMSAVVHDSPSPHLRTLPFTLPGFSLSCPDVDASFLSLGSSMDVCAVSNQCQAGKDTVHW